MIEPRHAVALASAAGVAILMPVSLLLPGPEKVPSAPTAATPLAPATPPPLSALYERPLFTDAAAEDAAAPADAPQLVGIAGRLGQDAVALVRSGDGTTRALRIGESVDGWQLANLAIDAAFFTRGAQRARVPLPAGE